MPPVVHTADHRSPDRLVVAVSHADDTAEFAERLTAWLVRFAAPVEVWRDDEPTPDPVDRAVNKIRAADVLLFLISRAIGQGLDPCRGEVEHALSIGMDTVGILVHPDASVPDWASDLEVIDGSAVGDWSALEDWLRSARSGERRLAGWAERYKRLSELVESSAGYRQRRYREAAVECEWRLNTLALAMSDLKGADRQSTPPARNDALRVFKEPPVVPEAEFRDREEHLSKLVELLKNREPLIAVTGPSGIGKTGMVSRLLAQIRAGRVDLSIDGFVYLPVHGLLPVSAPLVVRALARESKESGSLLGRSVPWRDLLDEVLNALAKRCVVLVIDNAEDLLDSHGRIRDHDLCEVLDRLVERRDHGVRPVLVTQTPVVPGAHVLPINQGLEHPFAEGFLRALDTKELLGPDSTDDELKKLGETIGGSPRGLELAYRLITGPDEQSATWLRRLISAKAPDDVVSFLFGWTFERLETDDKRIAQALAIYGRPVPPAAVDYLLAPHVSHHGSEERLRFLCRIRLIRQDGNDHFYLPPRDRELVIATVKRGQPQDDDNRLTRFGLYRRGARYFAESKVRDEKIDGVEHLTAHFAEIDLTLRVGDNCRAQDLIDAVDARHLHSLGHSITLVPFIDRLGALPTRTRELRRLCTLVWAYRQQKDHDRVLDHAEAALLLARVQHDRPTRAGLLIQTGNSHLDRGEWTMAFAQHQSALRVLKLRPPWSTRRERAAAHIGLATSHLHGGRFDKALRHHARAVRLLGPIRSSSNDLAKHKELAQMRVTLMTIAGLVAMHRHRPDQAAEHLNRAVDLAKSVGLQPELGLCHLHRAHLFVNTRDFAAAVQEAGAAAESGGHELWRDAKEILALACLCTESTAEAERAIAEAVRHQPTVHGLLFQGIIRYREGDLVTAAAEFDRARRLAENLREPAGSDFALLDAQALANAGFGLSRRQPELIGTACDLYRQARTMTGNAAGPRRRNEILLDQFRSRAAPDALARLHAAAVRPPTH